MCEKSTQNICTVNLLAPITKWFIIISTMLLNIKPCLQMCIEEHNKRFVQLFMRNRSENPEYFIFWALRDEPDTNTIHVFTGLTTLLMLLTQQCFYNSAQCLFELTSFKVGKGILRPIPGEPQCVQLSLLISSCAQSACLIWVLDSTSFADLLKINNNVGLQEQDWGSPD